MAKTNITQGKVSNMEALQQASTAIATAEVDNTQRLSVSHATLVNAITSAGLSRRYALQMELSSGLALFLSMGGVTQESKESLMGVYCESGYDAGTSSGSDYKTCHRRLTASALLYDHIGPETIGEWCAGTAEMMSITAISKAIEPLKLTSIDAARAYAGKPRKLALTSPESVVSSAPTAQHTQQAPSASAQQVEITTEAQYDSWLKKRGATPLLKPEAIEAGFRTVSTEHLSLVIPPECGKDEIVKFAMATLAVAQEMESPAQEEAQDDDTHVFEKDDARGNIHPSAPKRSSAGNVAVPEAVAQDKDGNVATAKPSRYRAAPKKAKEMA